MSTVDLLMTGVSRELTFEAEASLNILKAIETGSIKSITSDILKLEVYHADPIKKIYIIPI